MNRFVGYNSAMIARYSHFEFMLPDDLRDFLVSEAAKAGCADLGDYVLSILRDIHGRGKDENQGVPSSSAPSAWEIALRIGSTVPESEWAKVPPDLAANIDQYLYGAPRKE